MGNYSSKLIFWNQLGPLFLVGASAALAFQFSLLNAGLLLFAIVGTFCIQRYNRAGLYLAFLSLTAASLALFFTGRCEIWSLFLSGSIALSWFLAVCARDLSQAHFETVEQNFRQQELHLEEKSKQEGFHLQQLSFAVQQWKERAEVEEGLKQKALARLDQVSQEISSYQGQLQNLQFALEAAQAELVEQKNVIAPIAQQHNVVIQTASEEEVSWRHQYFNLRDQFEEKCQSLNQARKELFQVETALMAIEKEQLEKECSASEESLETELRLKELEENRSDLEFHVQVLSDLITEFLAPKKEARPRKIKKESKQESLPLMLQDKIDQQQTTPSSTL